MAASKSIANGFIRYKLHRQGGDTVLAAADEEALGVRHEGGGRVLDLVAFRPFYDGERAEVCDLGPLFSKCTSANLVGGRVVDFALREGLVTTASIVSIGGVSHVQFYRIAGK